MENKQEQKVPLGLTAKMKDENNEDLFPSIPLTFQQLFELFRMSETLSNLLVQVKQQNMTEDKIRFYFPEDIVTEEIEGNKVQKLREDFWERKEEETKNEN